MRSIDRPLAVTLGVVLVLVVAAVVVVATGRDPEDLDPASPEGVVQRYVEAVLAGDESEAVELLTDDAAECGRIGEMPQGSDDVRVALRSVEIEGDDATVVVTVSESGGTPPFGRYDHTSEERFHLDRVGGEWRIDRAPWRFQIWFDCVEEDS